MAMNTAILLAPRDRAIEFTTPTEPEALHSHLADGAGRLVPVLAHLSFEQVLAENLDLGRCDPSSTLVVYVGPHVLLDSGEAESLQLPDRFEMEEQYIDEQVDQGMQDAYERVDGEDLEGARQSYTEIDKLLADREKARQAGDFETADAIREQLAAMEVQVIDTPDGTRWRRV